MALPASGAISFRDINVELGLSPTAAISLGSPNVRTLFGIASGAIAMGAGYGKSNEFNATISSNQTDLNLRTWALANGWDGSSAATITIGSGVYISSSSTGTPALTINGSFPAGVTLVNNGYVIGMGGAGGNGGGVNPTTSFAGSAGSAGGGALSVSVAVTINNASGTIGGGGGGGGGGSGRYIGYPNKNNFTAGNGGGGGGGGRSSAASNSSGGTGGVSKQQPSGTNGNAGTSSAGGTGGTGNTSGGCTAGDGGTGATWGSTGSTGTSGSGGDGSIRGPYAGGSSGYAVSGNSNITYTNTGTRLGAIS